MSGQQPIKCQIKACFRLAEHDLPFRGKKIRVCTLCREIIMHKLGQKIRQEGPTKQ